MVQLNSIHFYGKKRANSSFLVPRNLKVVLGRGPFGKKWVLKKIQMEPLGFQKMKLRFPSSAVYMENLRESVNNLWFGDKVSKIRDFKIKVGAPEQLQDYTRPKSRRFYGPGFILRHILGHFDPRIESSPCL